MNVRNLSIAVAFVAATAVPGMAQVSAAKAEWAKGPVQFLMTNDEKTAWQKVTTDADADAFAALFWARRDPTPNTPENEFREEYEAKVKYADQNFKGGRQRGALSDRGKALILFGSPSKATKQGGKQPSAAAFDEDSPTSQAQQEAVRVTWLYEGDAAQKAFGVPRATFTFVDQLANGDYRLTNAGIDMNAAQQKAIAATITQPALTTAPMLGQQRAAAQQQATTAAPAAATPSDALKTAALESAVAEAKGGKVAKNVNALFAEFVSPSGESYIPLQIYVPASAGISADGADTIFGVVEDASGKRVAVFEEPVKLTLSKGDFFADRTVLVPAAGKYTAVVGLAKGGAPVAVTVVPIEASTPAADSVGVSKLILSDNIYELAAAEPVKAPFAFGRLKIVPKGNLSFANNGELGYFVEVNNPGIDTASNLPKLQYKLDLVGPDKKTISAPLSDVQALPLSGSVGPGHYAIVSTIPLGEMKPLLKPGDYTLKMKIVDTVTKQSYTVEQPFKITG
ncbi:MAG: GWxTD domain-containing protein [Acidobacteriota bacterium]